MTTMEHPTAPEHCTGCQCCRLVCPAGAIAFLEDGEGFPVPLIDENRCTGCGLCAKRCPANAGQPTCGPRAVLGARYRQDDEKLYNSASGGVFLAAAEWVLANGGLVFGAALDEDNVCRHVGIDNTAHIRPLQNSKYVQSDVRDTFVETETALKAGRTVLYSGTPCQIAGLCAYLAKPYDNLFTMDLICYGVPSPALFRLYMKSLEERGKDGKVIRFDFRSKGVAGWNVDGILTKIATKKNTKYIPPHKNAYVIAFLARGNCLRECCYSCPYTQTARVGDVTAADFWGVQKTHPEYNDARGCSLVFVNTEKGVLLWEQLSKSCVSFPSSLEKALPYQRNLARPTARPQSRDWVLRDIHKRGTEIFKRDDFRSRHYLLHAINWNIISFAPKFMQKPYIAVRAALYAAMRPK